MNPKFIYTPLQNPKLYTQILKSINPKPKKHKFNTKP